MKNVIESFSRFLVLLEEATERKDLSGGVIPFPEEEGIELQIFFPEDEGLLTIKFKNEDIFKMSDEEIVEYIKMRYVSRVISSVFDSTTVH